MQKRTLSPSHRCCVHIKSLLRKRVPARSAGGKQRWQWVSPTPSKPDIGKGLYQTVHIIGTRASGYPSWPGVADSTQGRIHWRRPTAMLRFSLATLRRTIHSAVVNQIRSLLLERGLTLPKGRGYVD